MPLRFSPILIGSVIALAVLGGLPRPSRAEDVENVASTKDGTVYQVDMDTREAWVSKTGWLHVSFLISTKAEQVWHRATAACATPGVGGYDVKVDAYDWGWEPGTTGYPSGTIAGDIARAVCKSEVLKTTPGDQGHERSSPQV